MRYFGSPPFVLDRSHQPFGARYLADAARVRGMSAVLEGR